MLLDLSACVQWFQFYFMCLFYHAAMPALPVCTLDVYIMYNPIIGVCSNFYIFIAFDPTAWQWALSWDWGSVKSPHMVVSSGFWCKFNLYIICPPPLDNAAITSQPKPLPDTTRLTGNLHPEELKTVFMKDPDFLMTWYVGLVQFSIYLLTATANMKVSFQDNNRR